MYGICQAVGCTINGTGSRSVISVVAADRRGDRAKYHYMASVSSFSFGSEGQGTVATCQESTNTYEGLMDLPTDENGVPGNQVREDVMMSIVAAAVGFYLGW